MVVLNSDGVWENNDIVTGCVAFHVRKATYLELCNFFANSKKF